MFWPSLKPDMLRTPQLQLHYEEDYRRVLRMLQKNATPCQAVKSSSAENVKRNKWRGPRWKEERRGSLLRSELQQWRARGKSLIRKKKWWCKWATQSLQWRGCCGGTWKPSRDANISRVPTLVGKSTWGRNLSFFINFGRKKVGLWWESGNFHKYLKSFWRFVKSM